MHPNLIPLLTDGAFIIDNSSLETFSVCPRSYQYSHVQKRIVDRSRAALDFGSAVHTALEWRYKNCGREEPTPDQTNTMIAVGTEVLLAAQIYDDYRTPEYLDNVIRNYNANNQREPFDIVRNKDGERLVERSFLEPLGEIRLEPDSDAIPILWSGKIDLVVSWDNGTNSTLDHKTSAMGGDFYFTEYQNSQPQLGYVYVAEKQLGITIESFVVNALVCRKPAASGKINLDFDRRRISVSRPKLIEWRENVLENVRHLLYAAVRNNFPMHMKACVGKYGACQYLDMVCTLPPAERPGIIASNYFKDNKWSPLTH